MTFISHWLGQVEYQAALAQQREMVEAHLKDADTPDSLLLLEHPPTLTLGRCAKREHLLVNEATLQQRGFALFEVERGGDITYHGPGQLVGYPILNLKRLYRSNELDLHRYISDIEEVLIVALAEFGVKGWRYPGYTGVWVDFEGDPAKIAAIGIKVNSKGITSHGFALNISTDLSHFDLIVPCGICEHGVISLSRLLRRTVAIDDARPCVIEAFRRVFGYENNNE
ncbi:octanoyltransferase [Candidatus Moduliflexus flocculans]|uniref:Octanoyltransferase n=1 Tax=Candidatus Moduliflexus flocculans TaxID=1499966 RepID=A0A081BNP5_9BACT|nr:octanoyltransferase [Candidatus Moduliflexus flocculans]